MKEFPFAICKLEDPGIAWLPMALGKPRSIVGWQRRQGGIGRTQSVCSGTVVKEVFISHLGERLRLVLYGCQTAIHRHLAQSSFTTVTLQSSSDHSRSRGESAPRSFADSVYDKQDEKEGHHSAWTRYVSIASFAHLPFKGYIWRGNRSSVSSKKRCRDDPDGKPHAA